MKLNINNLKFFDYPTFNISLETGSALCLLGPNGSGKSTILKRIMECSKQDSSNFLFGDVDLKLLNNNKRSRLLGILLAENEEIAGFKVEDIVSFGRYAAPESQSQSELDRSLNRFQLINYRKRDYSTLSSGEKRRVLFSRLDYQNPSIFVLDEPISFLDYEMRKIFANWVLDKKSEGKIIIFSTHDWSEAVEISDYALLIVNDKKEKNIIQGDFDNIYLGNILENLNWRDDQEEIKFNFAPETYLLELQTVLSKVLRKKIKHKVSDFKLISIELQKEDNSYCWSFQNGDKTSKKLSLSQLLNEVKSQLT